MAIVASVLMALAAVVHLGFFAMESMLWSSPGVWRRFGVASQRDADAVRPMAYNQGFYNLFLAIGAIVGLILFGVGMNAAGLALIYFTMASMLAAAVVLVTTGRGYLRPAIIQGTLPLIGIVLMLLS